MAVKGRKRTTADYRRMEESVKAGRVFTAPLRYNYFESGSTGQTENNPYANSRYLPPDAAGTGERRYAPEVNDSLLYGKGGSADQNQNAFGHTEENPPRQDTGYRDMNVLDGVGYTLMETGYGAAESVENIYNTFAKDIPAAVQAVRAKLAEQGGFVPVTDPHTGLTFNPDDPETDRIRSAILDVPIDQLPPLPGAEYAPTHTAEELEEIHEKAIKRGRELLDSRWTGVTDSRNDYEEKMNVDPKSGWGIAGNVGKAVGGMAIPSATALLTGGAGAPLLGGALTAAVEVATERLFGGVTGVGEGMIDDIGEKILGRALGDSKGMSVVKAAFDSLGEGAEEYITSQAGTLISRVYDREAAGKSWGELLSENRADALYDGLIGTLTSAVMKTPGEVNRLSESGAERRAEPGAAGSGIQNENGGVPAAITKGGIQDTDARGEIQDADVRSGFQAVTGDADRFFFRLHGIDPDTGMVTSGGMEAESWKPNAAGESAAAADDGVHASVNTLNPAKNPAPDLETARFDLYRRMFGSGDTGGEVQTENGVPTAVSKGEIQNTDAKGEPQTVTGDADRFFLRLHGIDPDTGMLTSGGMEAEGWKPNAQVSNAVQAVLQNSAPDKTSAVLRDSGDKRYNQEKQGNDELLSADRHKQGAGGDSKGLYSVFGEMSDADGLRYNQYKDDISEGLDTNTRVKLNQWKYRPSAELYNKYKSVYDNPKYFNQSTGNVNYPGMNGDKNMDGFIDGEHTPRILERGMIIDRYGSNGSGKYFSIEGTSYEQRALPPFMEDQLYTKYKVVRPFEVDSGIVAPWFEQSGKGTQLLSKYSVEELKKLGYIVEIR